MSNLCKVGNFQNLEHENLVGNVSRTKTEKMFKIDRKETTAIFGCKSWFGLVLPTQSVASHRCLLLIFMF